MNHSYIEFDSRIRGIPCRICARWYPASKGCYEPHGLQLTPDEPAGIEDFEVLDTRGRPAEWLARKMTDADVVRVQEDANRYMDQDNY